METVIIYIRFILKLLFFRAINCILLVYQAIIYTARSVEQTEYLPKLTTKKYHVNQVRT